MRRLVLALLCVGCGTSADLQLEVHYPADKTVLGSVARVNMTATRNSVVLASSTTSDPNGTLHLSGLSYGTETVVTLEGVDRSGEALARGSTCPLDFEKRTGETAVYFSPLNLFAPTASAPIVERTAAAVAALDDGTVIIAGGTDSTTALLSSSEKFAVGASTFTLGAALNADRASSQAAVIPDVGLLLVGGLGTGRAALASAELYLESSSQFTAITDSRLVARVDHRAVVLSSGEVFVMGGWDGTTAASALATSQVFYVGSDGSYQISTGPTLLQARHGHAAVATSGVPNDHVLVFGGYDTTGAPLATIELLDPTNTTATAAIATLSVARADATASLLDNGAILITGGVGADGAPLATAELYDPVSRTSSLLTLAVARTGHTATTLADGTVLVTGGTTTDGSATDTAELFNGSSFLSERSLVTARSGHAAVSLCDGTVLVVGGGSGAELYTPN